MDDAHNEQSCPQKTCFKCGQEGHLVGNCPHKSDKITCFKCNKKGHKIHECQIILYKGTSSSSGKNNNNIQQGKNQNNGHGRNNNNNNYGYSNDPFEKDYNEVHCVNCYGIGHICCMKNLGQEKDDIYGDFALEVLKLNLGNGYGVSF